jgi:hypothetical protein
MVNKKMAILSLELSSYRKICSVLLVSAVFVIQFTLGSSVLAQEVYCAGEHQDVSTPLNDLGGEVYIRMDGQVTGFTGGLYPSGSNLRPTAHESAGISIANQITPLNLAGNPDLVGGKIAMVSVGMSNTAMEFNAFIDHVEADAEVNPHLTLVNGAIPGQTAETWVDPNAPTWQELDNRLAQAGLSPAQVQVAWVKQTRTGGGAFPDKAQVLQGDLEAIARNLKTNFPNIKIVYFSSRTRGYTYWSGLSPEPAAFEGGFAVKWLIESQINGNPDLNYDPANGEVVAPYLSWGPYLWIDGLNPRSDGLTWTQEDLVQDCTHPSSNGEEKVVQMLLGFFKNDTTTRWFLAEQLPVTTYYLNFPIMLR